MVFDTKFLATEGVESNSARNGLRDLLEPFKKVDRPLILLHEKHSEYGGGYGKDHEAGFDSKFTCSHELDLGLLRPWQHSPPSYISLL